MTIKEFLLSSFLSLTSAFGLYFIIAYVKERKWFNIILITLLFIAIVILLVLPSTNVFLSETTIGKFGIPLIVTLLLIFIIILFLSYFNNNLGKLKKIRSYIVDGKNKDILKKRKVWAYSYIERERGIVNDINFPLSKELLNLVNKAYYNKKFLYQLLMPSGYRTYDLTFINPFKDSSSQLGLVHIIHQENYISWIDVIYWRILNHFSNQNVDVQIFISDLVASNKTFMAYLRHYLGDKVVINDSLFNSLHNLDNYEKKITGEKRFDQRQPNYNKLQYFTQLSPLLMSKKHTFVLLWEGYYTKFKFYNCITKQGENSIELKSESQEHPISISLNNYRTEFLLAPTCKSFNQKGEMNEFNPKDTFLLGVNSTVGTYNKISELDNYTLLSISKQVLSPALSWIESKVFLSIITLVIAFRKEREQGVKIEDYETSTKIISKLFVFISNLIHNRIIKNARL